MRHSCQSQGRSSKNNRWGNFQFARSYFHCPRGADPAGLDVCGANVSFDIWFTTEGDYPPLETCSGGCGLARVYLLGLLQRQMRTGLVNYFMILTKVPAQSLTYSRIGAAALNWEDASQSKTMAEEIWNEAVSSVQSITIV